VLAGVQYGDDYDPLAGQSVDDSKGIAVNESPAEFVVETGVNQGIASDLI
jgi:hypothetical protein